MQMSVSQSEPVAARAAVSSSSSSAAGDVHMRRLLEFNLATLADIKSLHDAHARHAGEVVSLTGQKDSALRSVRELEQTVRRQDHLQDRAFTVIDTHQTTIAEYAQEIEHLESERRSQATRRWELESEQAEARLKGQGPLLMAALARIAESRDQDLGGGNDRRRAARRRAFRKDRARWIRSTRRQEAADNILEQAADGEVESVH